MTAEVEATPLRALVGEASFLGRPEPTALTSAPEPEQEQPEPSRLPAPDPLPEPPLLPAASRPPAVRAATTDGLGRLVRTSVSLYEGDQAWLKDVAEHHGSVGVRRATKDFVARGLIRAVVELDPDLDLRGITLDDEDEFVERVKTALTDLGR